jgi:hypothetical protein
MSKLLKVMKLVHILFGHSCSVFCCSGMNYANCNVFTALHFKCMLRLSGAE